jgi:diketogulonate reductase-like aldo/keto reductase
LEKVQEIVAAARIKPAVVQVESHPYLPEWELFDFCREHGIVLLAFAALGHGMNPKVLDDPVIAGIAQRIHKTPAQVALAWAVQRGTACLTTSTTPHPSERTLRYPRCRNTLCGRCGRVSRRTFGSIRW